MTEWPKIDKISIEQIYNKDAPDQLIGWGIGFWMGEEFMPQFTVRTLDDIGLFSHCIQKRYAELKEWDKKEREATVDAVAEEIRKKFGGEKEYE